MFVCEPAISLCASCVSQLSHLLWCFVQHGLATMSDAGASKQRGRKRGRSDSAGSAAGAVAVSVHTASAPLFPRGRTAATTDAKTAKATPVCIVHTLSHTHDAHQKEVQLCTRSEEARCVVQHKLWEQQERRRGRCCSAEEAALAP